MDEIDKPKLIADIIALLEDERRAAIEAANFAKDTATNDENVAENKFDTLGLEASYLAAGQSNRILQIEREIASFDRFACINDEPKATVSMFSLVTLRNDENLQKNYFLIAPGAAGKTLKNNGNIVTVITLKSPLGKQIIGKSLGDMVAMHWLGENVEFELVGIL